jgi:hypothetical protein
MVQGTEGRIKREYIEFFMPNIASAMKSPYLPAKPSRDVLSAITTFMRVTQGFGSYHLYFYLRLRGFYQGQLTEEAVLPDPPSRPEDLEGELSFDTVTYGVGNWRVYHHNRAGAVGLFRNVVKGEVWNSWGFIGSELELLRGEKQQESVALPYH